MFQILNPLALRLHSERKQVELQRPSTRSNVAPVPSEPAAAGEPTCGAAMRLQPAPPRH